MYPLSSSVIYCCTRVPGTSPVRCVSWCRFSFPRPASVLTWSLIGHCHQSSHVPHHCRYRSPDVTMKSSISAHRAHYSGSLVPMRLLPATVLSFPSNRPSSQGEWEPPIHFPTAERSAECRRKKHSTYRLSTFGGSTKHSVGRRKRKRADEKVICGIRVLFFFPPCQGLFFA
jgi:hypothetical protein